MFAVIVRRISELAKMIIDSVFLIGQPYVPVGVTFQPKTIDLCAVNDPICSGGLDPAAHNAYPANGMVAQAAAFAAGRV